jgi:hypothetical protein
VRITFDHETDSARIFLSPERQSHERGATFAVLVHDEDHPEREAILVQVAFENYERLLWIKVDHASRALPRELLAQAEQEPE